MADQIHCPRCQSTQITAQKHGFSAGKAVAGAVIAGGIGALAGLHGSSDIDITCLNCGYTWNPKKLQEEKQQQQYADLKKWKQALYDAYDDRDFTKAESIYLSRYSYNSRMPDIHGVYKFYKKGDSQLTIISVVITVIIISVVIWIVA